MVPGFLEKCLHLKRAVGQEHQTLCHSPFTVDGLATDLFKHNFSQFLCIPEHIYILHRVAPATNSVQTFPERKQLLQKGNKNVSNTVRRTDTGGTVALSGAYIMCKDVSGPRMF